MSWTRVHRPLLALTLGLLLAGCAGQGVRSESGTRFVHVVFVWLKTPGDAAQIDRLIEATRTLGRIPGVREVRVGRAVPSDRAVVDDSFDVGLYMIFASRDDLEAYQRHPAHVAAVRDTLAPLAARQQVYDFVDTCAACGRLSPD